MNLIMTEISLYSGRKKRSPRDAIQDCPGCEDEPDTGWTCDTCGLVVDQRLGDREEKRGVMICDHD